MPLYGGEDIIRATREYLRDKRQEALELCGTGSLTIEQYREQIGYIRCIKDTENHIQDMLKDERSAVETEGFDT